MCVCNRIIIIIIIIIPNLGQKTRPNNNQFTDVKNSKGVNDNNDPLGNVK